MLKMILLNQNSFNWISEIKFFGFKLILFICFLYGVCHGLDDSDRVDIYKYLNNTCNHGICIFLDEQNQLNNVKCMNNSGDCELKRGIFVYNQEDGIICEYCCKEIRVCVSQPDFCIEAEITCKTRNIDIEININSEEVPSSVVLLVTLGFIFGFVGLVSIFLVVFLYLKSNNKF